MSQVQRSTESADAPELYLAPVALGDGTGANDVRRIPLFFSTAQRPGIPAEFRRRCVVMCEIWLISRKKGSPQLKNLSAHLPTIKARIKSTQWEKAEFERNIEANQSTSNSSLESTPIAHVAWGALAKSGPREISSTILHATRPNKQSTAHTDSTVSTLTRSTRYFFRQGSSFSYQNGSHGIARPATTRSQPQLVQKLPVKLSATLTAPGFLRRPFEPVPVQVS